MVQRTVSTVVREYNEFDTIQLLPMLRRYWEEMPHDRRGEFNEELVVSRLIQFKSTPCMRGFVAVKGTEIVGLLAAMLVPSLYWSTELHCMDVIYYVAPEHRGSGVARRLFRAFENWGEAAGAKRFYLSTASGLLEDRTVEYLQHLGYKQYATQLCKGV